MREIIQQLRARGIDSQNSNSTDELLQCQNDADGHMLCAGQMEPNLGSTGSRDLFPQ